MEAEITFEPMGRSGLIAVGTYLLDAANRLGVEMECEEDEATVRCIVKVKQGAELLSPMTKLESEYLNAEQRKHGSRLADHAKIEKEGTIVVMVKEKKDPEKSTEEKKAKEVSDEFKELPLEKKVARLLEMEMVTLSETLSFVFNSPYKIADKVMDVMAEFGLKMDKTAKDAKRPDEHKTDDKKTAHNGKEKSPESSASETA